MMKKIIVGLVLVLLVVSIGLFFWARAVFGDDTVRNALAAQLSKSLGQPVVVGSVGTSIYPRITVNLTDVAIGEPARIQIETLYVGTDLRAMLSRRIEHAALRLSGARIELPLPDFAFTSPSPGEPSGAASAPPVELVSIDEIVLNDVEVISGGRTLRGDVDLVPQAGGVLIRRAALTADNTTIDITGQIDRLSGPSGELTVTAGALNFDELLAFVSAFAGGAGVSGSPATAPARRSLGEGGPAPAGAGSAMNIAVSLDADSAKIGTLSLDKLSGRARVTPAAIALEPIGFALFGGKYDGSLLLTLGKTTHFKLNAKLSEVDMAAATTFLGSPDTITGRLSGTIDLSGSDIDAARAASSARGRARVDIVNGMVGNLGLVRTILIATSGRSDTAANVSAGSRNEPFERLGATLAIANGAASTDDLRFESDDLLLAAAGSLRLDGSAIDLAGEVQLSDELSKQAGRDLVRYTQEQGRATLPTTITGSAENPQVRIDMASLARRALTNRAKEEVQGAIKKGLKGLFGQ